MKPTHLYLSLATLLGGACGFAHPGAARVRLGGGHSGANRLARPQAAAAPADNGVDVMQAAKYPVATACQFGLIAALFRAIDAVGTTPAPLVPPLFALLSLRSRIFSLLPANRPPRGGFDVEGKRTATPAETIRPSWTPPGIAFPFIWLTITALRATAAQMAYAGSLRNPALDALVLHLCIGDTWNCITNVERRLGVSAVGCFAVWGSVFRAVKAFGASAAPKAAYVLAPSLALISIACVLTASIWNLNGRPPVYPAEGDGDSYEPDFEGEEDAPGSPESPSGSAYDATGACPAACKLC